MRIIKSRIAIYSEEYLRYFKSHTDKKFFEKQIKNITKTSDFIEIIRDEF